MNTQYIIVVDFFSKNEQGHMSPTWIASHTKPAMA